MEIIERPEWYDRAECNGVSSDVFFEEAYERSAKKICEVCVVQRECLEYALETRQDDGIWGGKNKKERLRIVRRRRVTYNNQTAI